MWSCSYLSTADEDSAWAHRRTCFGGSPHGADRQQFREFLTLPQLWPIARADVLIGDDLEVPAFQLFLQDSLEVLADDELYDLKLQVAWGLQLIHQQLGGLDVP